MFYLLELAVMINLHKWYDNFGENNTPLVSNCMAAIPKISSILLKLSKKVDQKRKEKFSKKGKKLHRLSKIKNSIFIVSLRLVSLSNILFLDTFPSRNQLRCQSMHLGTRRPIQIRYFPPVCPIAALLSR